MKFKKVLSLVLVASVATSLFVGCGKKDDKGAAGSGPSTVKVMLWATEAKNQKAVIDQFNNENKDTKIEVVEAPDNEYPDKLTVTLASGNDVDVFGTNNVSTYADLATKKQCLDLGELIDKNKLDLKNYNGLTDDMKIDGKLYGLPVRKTAWALYYNKDLFDKAGVAYPKDDMTWVEFRNLAKQMTKGDGADKTWGTFIQTWDNLYQLSALQKGKTIFSEDLKAQKESIQFLNDLYKDGSASNWGTNKSTSAHYRAAFEKGNIAMMPMGDFLAGSLISDKAAGKHNVNWDVVSLPHPEGVAAKTTFGTATPMSINAKTKNKDAAWKVLSYLTGEKGAINSAKLGILPGYINDEVNKVYGSAEGTPAGVAKTFLNQKVVPELPVGKNVKSTLKVFYEQSELYYIGKNDLDTTMSNIENQRKAEMAK
ncbi:multiple sugar transport system substrate-binding protein [Clostridium cavendishii DSM 21758]|uniref:Multiple sugar transport system substrate-binding protein n=1 Tax=Clostridium cavendishii DSM 21758 TaxID=1121302 RepID=A0A1M6G684_9CLOT|nr:sugar ABC transporter substrate-binding protein [Clostridium cavendishii]SHJ05465.1 multiple sugar transport system substrate-binding protein [Clostridium cavendishii DSM 21758]